MSNFTVVSKQLVSIHSRQVNNFVNKIHGGIKASMLHKVRHYCNYKLIACPLPWKEFTRNEGGAFTAPAAMCCMGWVIIKICWRTLVTHLNMTYSTHLWDWWKCYSNFPQNGVRLTIWFAQRHYGHIKIMIPKGVILPETQRVKHIMCLDTEVGWAQSECCNLLSLFLLTGKQHCLELTIGFIYYKFYSLLIKSPNKHRSRGSFNLDTLEITLANLVSLITPLTHSTFSIPPEVF